MSIDLDTVDQESQSTDDDSVASLEDFVVDDDSLSGLAGGDLDLVEFVGHLVPRAHLEMLARLTPESLVVSSARILTSSPCCKLTIADLTSAGLVMPAPDSGRLEQLSPAQLVSRMVLSSSLQRSLQEAGLPLFPSQSQAISLSALQTLFRTKVTDLSSTGTTVFGLSESLSSHSPLYSQLILVQLLQQLARMALRPCSSTPPRLASS